MADVSAETLRKEVKDFLKGADLTTVTGRIVREGIEAKLGVDLSHRRKEIDKLIMADVEDQVNSDGEISEEDKKESDYEPEEGDDDYHPAANNKKKAKPPKRKVEDEGSDEEWGKKKKQQKKKPGAGGKPKQSAFTKSFKLSPELADVVGKDVMPRHEVVKKLWAVIKERGLQDPKQKQFAICDDQLFKVFGVKRFRSFGMMKFLKGHFLEAA